MTAVDAAGTCHAVGCPGKGQHAPHGIGAGTWDDYTTKVETCLGFPVIRPYRGTALMAVCSIRGSVTWALDGMTRVSPQRMATLVDQHKQRCTNRDAR